MPQVPQYRNPAHFKKQKKGFPIGLAIGVGIAAVVLIGGMIAVLLYLTPKGVGPRETADANQNAPSSAESESANDFESTAKLPQDQNTAGFGNSSLRPKPAGGSADGANSGTQAGPEYGVGPGPVANSPIKSISSYLPKASGDLQPVPNNLRSAGLQRLSEGGAASMRYQLKPNVDYGISFVVELNSGSRPQITKGRTVYRLVNENPQNLLSMNAGSLEQDFETQGGTGTGFAIHPDGIILTCAHVVEGVEDVMVNINNRDIPGRVVAIDAQNDLAIVRVEHQFDAIIGLNDQVPELGESCRAIGFPLSSELGRKVKMSTGTIVGDDVRMHERRLQIDATVNPGNSGGPVVGEHGELFGVADSIMVAEGTQDVSFAVPVDVVAQMLRRIMLPFDTSHFGERASDSRTVKSYKDAIKCAFLITVGAAKSKTRLDGVDLMVLSFDSQMQGSGGSESVTGGRIVADRSGKVYFTSQSPSLPFFVNRASTIGFERFPSGNQTSWKSIETMQVSVNMPGPDRSEDPLAGLLGFDTFRPGFRHPGNIPIPKSGPSRISQEITVAKIQAYKTDSSLDFSKEFAILGGDPIQERPQLIIKGSGKSSIDAESGFAKSATVNGDFRSALGGKSQTGTIRITYGYMTEAEMQAQEAAEAERQRQLAEAAKIEAEKRRLANEKAAAERRQKLAEEIKARDGKLSKSLDLFDPDK